jgi:peptidoglycan/LPS O-acetylase OafA/YrhL
VVAVDLGYLLPIIWLLAATAGLSPRLERTLGYLSCLPLFALCLWRLARGLVPDEPYTWLGLISLLAACVLTRFPISRAHLARLAPIGVISYAVYALAAPIQHIVLSLPLPSGHFSTWIARIVLVVALALGAGYICERTIPRWLKRRRAPCASPS